MAADEGRDAATPIGRWRHFRNDLVRDDRSGLDLDSFQLDQALVDLGPEDLATAIREAAKTDLSKSGKNRLLGQMISRLALSDPKTASGLCELLKSDHSNSSYHTCVRQVLSEWVKTDCHAAAAWLDSLSGQKEFSTINSQGERWNLCQLERIVAGTLVRTDPQAAAERMRQLPKTDREQIFLRSWYVPPIDNRRDARDWVLLAREVMPAAAPDKVPGEERTDASQVATDVGLRILAIHGLAATGAYLDDIRALPLERKAIAEKVCENRLGFDRQQSISGLPARLDETLNWLRQSAPEDVFGVAGEVLASSNSNRDFQEIAALTAQYAATHDALPLLTAFLSSETVVRDHAAEAMAYLDRIPDPATREALRRKLESAPEVKKEDAR